MTALVNLDHQEEIGVLENKLTDAKALLFEAQHMLDWGSKVLQQQMVDRIRAFLGLPS